MELGSYGNFIGLQLHVEVNFPLLGKLMYFFLLKNFKK